jgi:NTP pyrophosphatase (non-canonical NTP hydrolase)
MRISEFQRHVADLYRAKDERRGKERTFLWLMEEVGELAEAIRRGERDGLEEEFADVMAWLASLASLEGVDLEAAVARKYPDKCKRCGAKPCACPEPTIRRL